MEATAMKTKVLTPTGSRLLVRRLEAEEKTPGGIVLPDNAKEKPQQAIVEAIGPGKLIQGVLDKFGNPVYDRLKYHKGQTVILSRYAGTEVKLGGKEYLIIESDEILATVE
jgi:chaperonin GroES